LSAAFVFQRKKTAAAMPGLVELLGEKLLTKDGEGSTAQLLSGKKAVALYFSGHWCPPCRGFTPQLAEWYKSDLQAKGLEVVFVSSDRDEDGFKSYFGEMPWLALPYSDRDRKNAISSKFKVQGIPTVVILDGEGNVMTKDGRTALSSDPKGEGMPWKDKTLKEILAGSKIIDKSGEVGPSALEGKVFAFYFSGHWCPPCRGFTPKFAEWYTKSLKAKGLEVVFVSSDRDEGAFKEYYAEMPWLALDYGNRKEKQQLDGLFGIEGIPSVVIIDKDGSVISKEGRGAISADPEGAEFPWYPKPVKDLAAGPGPLNETACVVALCEAASKDVQAAAEAAMEPLAKKYIAKAKEEGEDDPKVAFMIAKEAGGISGQLRRLMELPADGPPSLMLINIPDNGAFYAGPGSDITAASVETFVTSFESGKAERKQLKRG